MPGKGQKYSGIDTHADRGNDISIAEAVRAGGMRTLYLRLPSIKCVALSCGEISLLISVAFARVAASAAVLSRKKHICTCLHSLGLKFGL